MHLINMRKAAIVGCGDVGASIAFSLMHRSIFTELVLIDVDRAKAEGEAMDLSDGIPYAGAMDVYAGDYRDAQDCAMMIVTAGANQKPGETRLQLIDRNVRILSDVIGRTRATSFEGIMLIVANPVDVLTYEAHRLSGYPASRVFGSGTVLDTARLKHQLSRYLGVDSRNIHAFIIGEHGDSELAVWSSANVSGIDLDRFLTLRGHTAHDKALQAMYENVRDSAYAIIERKGSTYYGIAMAVSRIAECIVRDEQAVLPVSTVLGGEYGLSGVALSIPAIVGKGGVEAILEIPLSESERLALGASAAQLRDVIATLGAHR